ncbi:MAG: HK97 family phage prohead protease [Candidatus Methanomethylicaceae archaeon]
MGAIKPHSTKVDTESSWDGPGVVADAPNDAEVLRYMHAWVDDNGDPDAKSSYKFPHHQPKIGAPAVIAAVNNALARLSQADIPDADRDGVERHLRKHRDDAGLEEKAAKELVELRTLTYNLRAEVKDDEPTTLTGYAAVFNQWSEDLGGFRELIRPGAFEKAIQNADVRALINHDANYVLGRTTSGTLRLEEDEIGLRVEIKLPSTQYANDLVLMMKRGDINQMSFGFSVAEGGDKWYEQDGIYRREIISVSRLYDVSVVTFPAYPQTIAQARDVLRARLACEESAQESGAQAWKDEQELAAQERGCLDVKRKKIGLLNIY